MTPAQKKAYNEKYYREHSNYWKDFYSKGRLVGRPKSHEKNIQGGGTGVNRRGEALGTGPVGSSSKKKRSVDPTGSLDAWANVVGQTGDELDSYAYNYAMDIPNQQEPDWNLDAVQTYVALGGGTIYDNAVYAVAEAHGILSRTAKKGKAAVKSMLKDWSIGARTVKSLFKRKAR